MASSKQFGNLSSALKQRMQGIWRNPSAVSAIASLGFHGLLFVALPLLPYAALKAREPEIQEPVEMVELTPEEQKRLPNFSTLPPIELPEIRNPPQQSSDSDLFSFSTLPKSPSSLSPSPDSLFVPPPLPIFIPPAPPAPIPSFSIQIPTAPPPRPAAPPPAAPAPSPSATAEPSETEEIPDVAVEPASASPQPEQPDATPEAEVAASPRPIARSEEQIQQDLLARQQELRELYTYNPSGTSVEAANTSFLEWFSATMDREYAAGDTKPKEQQVTSDYPRLACPLKQSRHAVVGVAVDADNQLVGEPKILQSSGYRLFNEEALKTAESYDFENASGDKQLYLLKVNFEYSEETCPPGFAPLDPVG
jgi:outer membrane biosynthesis protein TonB